MRFNTVDVLSTSTGRLLGDIGGVYKVVSFLIGRQAFTHELAFYGKRAAAALKAALPALPVKADAAHVNGENYLSFVDEFVRKLGETIDLPDSLRDVLADDRNAVDTLSSMVPPNRIIEL